MPSSVPGPATREPAVTVERRGRVLLIGLNRPSKRNAFTQQMLTELATAYGRLEQDDDLWCGVLFGHGEHFTGGLDLADVGGALLSGEGMGVPAGGRDPWRLDGPWTKPMVVAVQGWVMTLAIELLLAADVRVAAADARFAQYEIRRGIYPFGGATFRFPQQAGWGNAMRWVLTGDEFDAAEALRIGLAGGCRRRARCSRTRHRDRDHHRDPICPARRADGPEVCASRPRAGRGRGDRAPAARHHSSVRHLRRSRRHALVPGTQGRRVHRALTLNLA
jgi:enoyl-CoA hydratase/carnithine racemase